MATTTNYGWTTPDDTGLVKDGASAIRSLGTAIDTTVKSNADAAINKTLIDAKGDLIVGSAADTAARLAVGTNDYVLTADSTQSTGVKWAAVSSGGMTLLSTTTLSGTSTTISSISQSYTNLWVVGVGIGWSTGNQNFRINPNGTASISFSSGVANSAVNTSGQISPFGDLSTGSNTTSLFSLTIDNYSSGTIRKPYMVYGEHPNTSGSIMGGKIDTTTAISSLVFTTSAATATLSGTIYIYGVK